MKPDQDLPTGPLGPAAFSIPEVLRILPKFFKNGAATMLGPRSVKALNPALRETKFPFF